MAAEWFLKVGNQVHGPMSAAELRQKAAAGLIGPEAPICKGADGQWVRAEKVRGLFPKGDSPPLAAPPPATVRVPPLPPPPPAPPTVTEVRAGSGAVNWKRNRTIHRVILWGLWLPVLVLLLALWVKVSGKVAWAITSVVATLAGAPPGPMNIDEATRWATVDAVIYCILIALGFILCYRIFDWIKWRPFQKATKKEGDGR